MDHRLLNSGRFWS